MKTVNALQMRNHFGQVLQELEENREPILLSKGKRVRAALITIEDFQRRFLDRQAEEERERWHQGLQKLRAGRIGGRSSLEVLRELRGYPD
jgi:PHD/YefM family antitoxin component YafN of YafNO toxin-antitoxin module